MTDDGKTPEPAEDAALDVSDVGGGVRQLLMREPKNRLSPPIRSLLRAAVEAADADPAVRAIVLGAAGKHFSVGGDLATMQRLIDASTSRKHAHMLEGNRLARTLEQCRKPLIAAVSGGCHGAGAGVVLLCDTVVIGASTKFGFPFLRSGLVPDFGISHTLPRRVGDAAARQLLLYARTIDAARAVAIGLADECVDDAEVLPKALELATTLAAMPAYALRLTKDMLRGSADGFESALRVEAMNQAQCFGSPDMREGVEAFFAKRAPRFNEEQD